MKRRAVLSLFVGMMAAAGSAAAASFEFPPLMQPPAAEHPGKLIWAELVTPDLAAAEHFYGGMFGWTFRDIRTGDTQYAIAMLGEAPVAGIVQRPLRPEKLTQPAWLTFLSVPNVHLARRFPRRAHIACAASRRCMPIHRAPSSAFSTRTAAILPM